MPAEIISLSARRAERNESDTVVEPIDQEHRAAILRNAIAFGNHIASLCDAIRNTKEPA